jgi:hypothetical protein
MSKCNYCGRGGYTNDTLDTLLGAFHMDAYYDDYPYEWWSERAIEGNTYHVPAVGDVKLVERKNENPDSYEQLSAHMVFEIEDVLYKKEGSSSSYNSSWDGVFKETHVATREVTYYA